jgi:hypothetical protein
VEDGGAVTAATAAANLGGVALFALPGLGLAELIAPLARLPLRHRLGHAFLLGVVAVAGALFAASHLFGAPLRRPAIAAACLAPIGTGIAAALRRRRRGRPRRLDRASPAPGRPSLTHRPFGWLPGGRRRHGAAEPGGPAPRLRPPWWRPGGRDAAGLPAWQAAAGPVAALLIAAVCLGPLAQGLSVPLGDWDGRVTWSVQAAYMRQEATVDARALRDAHFFIILPRYPPLLPVAQAAIQETFGAAQDEQLFRAFYVAFLAALLLVVHHGAERAAGPAAAAIATLAFALPPVLSYGMGGATSAYSDLPLAAFYGGALVLLGTAPPSPAAGFAGGCLLAGAVLAKSEGLLLAAAALALSSVRLLRWRRRPLGWIRGFRDRRDRQDRLAQRSSPSSTTPFRLILRSSGSPAPFPLILLRRRLGWLAAAALPPLAAAALLASWRAGIPDRFSSDYFHDLGAAALLRGFASRLPRIVHGVLAQSWRWSDWRGLWILVPAVLLAGHRALRRPAAGRLLLAGLAPGAIGLAAYALADIDLGELIPETWSRFLLQALAPLAIVFACALAELLPRSRSTVLVPAPTTTAAAGAEPAPASADSGRPNPAPLILEPRG